MKTNPLDKIVLLSLTPDDASVLLGALAGVQIILGEREPVIEDTISRIALQLRLMRQPPEEAKKAHGYAALVRKPRK